MFGKSRLLFIADYRARFMVLLAAVAMALHLLLFAGAEYAFLDLSDRGVFPTTLGNLYESGSLVLIAVLALTGVIVLQGRYLSSLMAKVKSKNEVEDQNERLAFTDEMTGLPNRRKFEAKLDALLKERNQTRRPFAIAFLDLDGFKPINDFYGHAAGDDILRQVALRLEGAVGDKGFVARFGGDEFGLICPGIGSEEESATLGDVLSEVLCAPYDLDVRKARLSASFGFAVFPEAGETAEELINRADTALYESKRAGRGKVSIYTRRLEDKLREQAVVEQALRRAIAERTIEPHYQPIVDLMSGKILGFEALARWTDSELGSVPPTKFIGIAEERGMIGDLTDLLFEMAAAEAARWPRDSFLSFNLSTVQLADVGTGLKMMSAMSKAGLDPRRLEIEITETALLGDVETAKDVIRTFRSSGVGVALDDFGTGHSSLGYLRELPLDKIKIDRSFVSGIETEKQSYHIIKAVLELCAGLELKVVAEGIEERQQASRLISHGCGAGQGYLFGRPMAAMSAHKLVWASARSEEKEFAVN